MKKIFGIIFLILLSALFIDIDDAFALDDSNRLGECLYHYEGNVDTDEDDIDFVYYLALEGQPPTQVRKRFKTVNAFSVDGEKYSAGETWDIVVKPETYDDWAELNKCYKYMYLDAIDWWKDKIYVSDSDSIDENYDVQLELVYYEGATANNAILNEMQCTYVTSISSAVDLFNINHRSYTFKIRDNGNGSGSYELYGGASMHGTFAKLHENHYTDYFLGEYTSTVQDNFDIRKFWDAETGKYACPPVIYVSGKNDNGFFDKNKNVILGYGVDGSTFDEYIESNWWTSESNYNLVYYLREGASYIDYQISEATQGNTCIYTREGEGEINGRWYVGLTQYKPTDKNYYYVAYFNDELGFGQYDVTYFGFSESYILDSCDKLPVIYTNCLTKSSGEACSITTTDDYGPDNFEKLVLDNYRSSQDITNVLIGTGEHTGFKYKQLICELKDRLEVLPNYNYTTLYKVKPLQFYNYDGTEPETVKIDDINCESWWVETNFDCDDECEQQIDYLVEKKIREITTYCQNKYNNFSASDLTNGADKGRMYECIAFNEFYSSLVSSGLVRDLSSSCKMLSNDFVDKLDWILDILKIAGPILAVGLGTLDFIKVVASGDADKEMKSAFKKFSIRIVSAILLFIVPVILAFLMDTFLGNQNGYDSDNPFCDVVEFNE